MHERIRGMQPRIHDKDRTEVGGRRLANCPLI